MFISVTAIFDLEEIRAEHALWYERVAIAKDRIASARNKKERDRSEKDLRSAREALASTSRMIAAHKGTCAVIPPRRNEGTSADPFVSERVTRVLNPRPEREDAKRAKREAARRARQLARSAGHTKGPHTEIKPAGASRKVLQKHRRRERLTGKK